MSDDQTEEPGASEPATVGEKIAELEEQVEDTHQEIAELKATKARERVESLEDFEALSATEKRELKEQAPTAWRHFMAEKRKSAEGRLFGKQPPRGLA
jgi:PHD/YefM family antitoxin component YafN of YafNO toxin-antitoxin module